PGLFDGDDLAPRELEETRNLRQQIARRARAIDAYQRALASLRAPYAERKGRKGRKEKPALPSCRSLRSLVGCVTAAATRWRASSSRAVSAIPTRPHRSCRDRCRAGRP